MSLLQLFCHVDDFWQGWHTRAGGVPRLSGSGSGVRTAPHGGLRARS